MEIYIVQVERPKIGENSFKKPTLGEHLVYVARKIPEKLLGEISILTDYVSRGDLLVGGVMGEGKDEGREKEDGREEGGGNAS